MRFLRSLGVVAATAAVLAGCGGLAEPTVTTDGEVVDALLALREGASARATAVLELDQDELRSALRDDTGARDLLRELVDAESADVDELVSTLAGLEEELGAHAIVLETGADGSGRLAAEYRDEVWLDLRARSQELPDGNADGDALVDVQARVDWAVVATLLERPSLRDELDEAVAGLLPFLGELSGTATVEQVLGGLLDGELVGVSGPAGRQLLDGLAGPDVTATVPDVDLEPRAVLETALAFDGFRRDGADTLVDVTIELRAVGELLLDRAADVTSDELATDELQAARDALAAMPVRLTDVAVLRIGPDGDLRQVRIDVLDAVLQTALATDVDDPRLAATERLASALDATGLFVLLDVDAAAAPATVLGDPQATATPAEVAAAVRAVLFGRLAGGLFDGLGQLEGLAPPGA